MSFSGEKVQQVWEKGEVIPKYDPKKWRKDACKAWIDREQYGNTNSIYGWEVDHITPKSEGGTDHISNLRPMQWENNRARADGKKNYCVITSDENKNIKK